MMFSKNATLPALSLLVTSPDHSGTSVLTVQAPPAQPGKPEGSATGVPASKRSPLPSTVVAARLGVPIDNWEFAERVWAGLRPHLRTRLWVLDTLQARGVLPGGAEEAAHLDQLVVEIHRVETEVEETLRKRSSLTQFSSLIEERLAPCLRQLEHLQEALHERHGA